LHATRAQHRPVDGPRYLSTPITALFDDAATVAGMARMIEGARPHLARATAQDAPAA